MPLPSRTTIRTDRTEQRGSHRCSNRSYGRGERMTEDPRMNRVPASCAADPGLCHLLNMLRQFRRTTENLLIAEEDAARGLHRRGEGSLQARAAQYEDARRHLLKADEMIRRGVTETDGITGDISTGGRER